MYKRILELRQYGFIKNWEDQYLPQQEQCSRNYRDQSTNTKPRISLFDLGGAFALLVVGISQGTFIFFVEKVVYYPFFNRAA